MSKSLSELLNELTKIHDQQKDLALKESLVKHEILKFETSHKLMNTPISEIFSPSVPATSNSSAWNNNAKIDRKAVSILRKAKKIMTNREVGEAIVEIEKNNDPEYIRFLIRKFSAVVGGRAKNKRTFNRIEIDGVLYYGLADWFEPNGSVKPEYFEVE